MGRQRAWLAVPKVSGSPSQMKKKAKEKVKGKGGFKTTGKAHFGEEQAQDPELWSEKDSAWWSKDKKGNKVSSKGKNNLPESDSRTYRPEKREQAMNSTCTKAEARIRKEKARKVPILSQNFQPQKHLVKKDMAIPGNLTFGVPVLLMIPQIQPQEEKLQGMERDILHGCQQSHWILPTIRHTLFWILAGHGQLDQERQSEDSRNMRCITALRQSFVVATSPLCWPTPRQRPVWKVIWFTSRQHLHVLLE